MVETDYVLPKHNQSVNDQQNILKSFLNVPDDDHVDQNKRPTAAIVDEEDEGFISAFSSHNKRLQN